MTASYIQCTTLICSALTELIERRGMDFPVRAKRWRFLPCRSIHATQPTKPNYFFTFVIEIDPDRATRFEKLLYTMIVHYCEKIVANWDIVEKYASHHVLHRLKPEGFLNSVKQTPFIKEMLLAGRFEVEDPNTRTTYIPSSLIGYLSDVSFLTEKVKEQVYKYWEEVFTDENKLFTHLILGTSPSLYPGSISTPRIKPITMDDILSPDDENEKWREALTLFCLMDMRKSKIGRWYTLKGRRVIPLHHLAFARNVSCHSLFDHFEHDAPFLAIHWMSLFYKNRDEIRKLLFYEEMKR